MDFGASAAGGGHGLRLLALDGGGTRGISILLILRSLLRHAREEENRTRETRRSNEGPLRACDYFDLIGGTNTGGLIALMLGRLRMEIDEAIQKYTELVSTTFVPSQDSAVDGGAQYDTELLEAKLKEMIADTGGSDTTALLTEDPSHCRVFVCARNTRNMNAGIPALFRSYRSVEPDQETCAIWEAARATLAIVGFFKPIVVGRSQSYVEGGLGCNNPIKLVLSEAAKQFPGSNVASVVSVGTGHPSTIRLTSEPSVATTLLQMATDSEARHNDMVEHFSLQPDLYHRFSVAQGIQDTDLTHAHHSAEVEAHTEVYLRANDTQGALKRIAKSMVIRAGKIPVQYLVSIPPIQIYQSLTKLSTRLASKAAQKYRAEDQGKPPCHPATRSEILGVLDLWIWSDKQSARCLWMTGIAGVGKTAIAITTVECLQDRRPISATERTASRPLNSTAPLLCAQYFCNHTHDSAKLESLFPTLALQLASISPAVAFAIETAVATKPSICTRFSLEQVERLFLEPLIELARIHAPHPVVVVLDGLDELTGEKQNALAEITGIIVSVAERLPINVRLLVLSRPDTPIMTTLDQLDLSNGHVRHRHLSTSESERDVGQLVEAELRNLGRLYALTNFPTTEAILDVCHSAAGHLGFAKQATKWLGTVFEYEGAEGIEDMIQNIGHLATGDMDALYLLILRRGLPPDADPRRKTYLAGLRQVLGALIAIKEPILIGDLSRLIAASLSRRFDVLNCLKRLSSIFLDTPALFSDSLLSPRPHKSFNDFLTSSDRAQELCLDEARIHFQLTKACFQVMMDVLHFNIGGFADLYITKKNIEDGLQRIPNLTRYVSTSLTHHLVRADGDFEMELNEWMSKKFLPWLEVVVMAWVDFDTEAATMQELRCVQSRYSTNTVGNMIQNGIEFLSQFRDCLRLGAPYLYATALPYCSSFIRPPCLSNRIISRSRQDGWTPSCDPTACAISTDGEHVAILSASGIFLLTTNKGRCCGPYRNIIPAEGIKNGADSELSFSRDAEMLLVANRLTGRKVGIVFMQVSSGEQQTSFQASFELDIHRIWRAQFSPSNALILLTLGMTDGVWVFVYCDGILKWSRRVSSPSTAFLSENQIILQQEDEGPILLVDSQTGNNIVVLGYLGDWLTSLAISPGSSVFTGFAHSIAVGNLEEILNTDKFPLKTAWTKGIPRQASYSKDGALLAVGMDDGSIQLWECSEWKHVTTLSGHWKDISEINFHSNGKQLVSYSAWDGTIRIWDISAVVEGREWDIQVKEGTLAEGSWFKHAIPLGGWFTGYDPPEPFVFQYPFNLPDGVEPLNWTISEVKGC